MPSICNHTVALSAEYDDANEGGDDTNTTVDGVSSHQPRKNTGAEYAL